MPQIIVVLGAHRSGTSALAGALAAAGAACGQPLLPANDGNPSGYWELAPLVELNERLLATLKRRWHDVAPLPGGWPNESAVRDLESTADDLLLGQFANSEFALLKDPRLCLTIPFWRRAILRLGWSLSLVVIARPVGEVVASLSLRELLDARTIAYLWARYMVEAARACFHDRALLLTYDRLVSAPRQALERIATRFDLPLEFAPSERFVDARLRHQTETDGVGDVPDELARFCAYLYGAIAEAAALDTTLGAARFRQTEVAMDALDRSLLLQMLQEALFTVREEREALIGENTAARENIEKLVAEIDAARNTIDGLTQEIANARQAHSDRDRIEQMLRARLAEAEREQVLSASLPRAIDDTPGR